MYGLAYFSQFIKNNNPIKIIKDKIYYKQFISSDPRKSIFFNDSGDIDLYIIGFNNSELLSLQYYFLTKNCIDRFVLTIVDNSTIDSESLKIQMLCEEKHINYLQLPHNTLFSSKSHGASLNYVMTHLVSKSKTSYFGLLDHDCFLIKKISIISILQKKKIWGLFIDNIYVKLSRFTINMSGGKAFLWPGCSFFKKDVFLKGFDFMPSKSFFPLSFLDTGGGNRKYVYRYLLKDKSNYLSCVFDEEGYQYIGDSFFHIGGGGFAWGKDISAQERVKKGIDKVLDLYK